MSHTAGPWAVHPVNAQVDAFVGGEPLPICQLLWPTTERTEAETKANASLIAAAPDLLAALKAVTDHFAAVMGGPIISSVARFPNGVEEIPTIARARAAIAKAEKLTQQQRVADTAGQGT